MENKVMALAFGKDHDYEEEQLYLVEYTHGKKGHLRIKERIERVIKQF